MEKPLVSIGIPAYDEGKYISDTIESVLSQTYNNIELIISDNCSTDDTTQKVKEIQVKYPEVRLVEQKKNIGAIQNFNFLKKEAIGDYFMWLGGHDIILPNYVEECLALFEKNSELILVYSKAKFFSQNKESYQNRDAHADLKTIGLDPVNGAMKVLNPSLCTAIHGVFDAKKGKTNLLRNIPIGPDNVFLFEIALLGEFDEVNDYLYFRREIREKETDEQRLKRYKEIFSLQCKNPYDSLKFELLKVVKDSKLSSIEKKVLSSMLFDVFLKQIKDRKQLKQHLKKVCGNSREIAHIDKVSFYHLILKLRYKILRK